MITNVTLTTKEQFLLQDQKSHEEQCVLKYENYANLCVDAQLKAVFRSNGQKEQEHLTTINQLISGKVPSMGGQSQGGQSQGTQNQGTASQGSQNPASMGGQNQVQATSQQNAINQSGSTGLKMSDKDMCTDMLNTEKYVSGTYDTAIFEFKDAQIRDVLNHIQKEEQKHGEAIFAYMQSKGMYSAQ
ncbi:MAG TPA: spore coat protein [Mobilitalea sp.]|nr:spore coat protein [Mobilitalea sp.]